MRSDDILRLVMQECSFLSHYLEEYENKVSTNPTDKELKELINTLSGQLQKYEKLAEYIKENFNEQP